jgi:hypothetical protein
LAFQIGNWKSAIVTAMTPEISHRCPSCGAAVREADALFCRECGKPLSPEAKTSEPAEAGHVFTITSDKEERQETKTAEAAATESSAVAPEAVRLKPDPVVPGANKPKEAKPGVPLRTDHSTAARRGDKTRERLHRASEVARGVIEEPAKQVEKIRHVSTVMIEEASYDPSLRFVLVALGLFVIFVILLVLSKVMG